MRPAELLEVAGVLVVLIFWGFAGSTLIQAFATVGGFLAAGIAGVVFVAATLWGAEEWRRG
jgi:hypothetical protein